MYIKNDFAYITDNLNSLPIELIQLGEQVVYLGCFDVDKYSVRKMDGVCHMVLGAKIGQSLLEFDCSSSAAEISFRTNDEDEEEIDGVDFNNKKTYKLFLKLPISREIIELCDKDNPFNRHEEIDVDEEDYHNAYSRYLKYIHDDLFKKKALDTYKSSYTEVDFFGSYFPIKLDDSTHIVFVINNNINVEQGYWSSHKRVFLFEENGVYELHVDFNKMFIMIKEDYKSDYRFDRFAEFENSIFVCDYDMRQYLNDKNKSQSISKIERELDWKVVNVISLFDPIYVNGDFKSYKNTIKSYSNSLLHMFGDNAVYFTKDLELHKNDIRRAKAVFNFNNQHKNGINPYDCLLYKNGELVEGFKPDYIDHSGAIVQVNREWKHYINLDGMYVQSDQYNDEDKKIINDMIKNRDMLITLLQD